MMFPYSGGQPGLRDRFYNACSPKTPTRRWPGIHDRALRAVHRAITTIPSGLPFHAATWFAAKPTCNPDCKNAIRERLGMEPNRALAPGHSPLPGSSGSVGGSPRRTGRREGTINVYEALTNAFTTKGTRGVFTMMGDANMYWLNALRATRGEALRRSSRRSRARDGGRLGARDGPARRLLDNERPEPPTAQRRW